MKKNLLKLILFSLCLHSALFAYPQLRKMEEVLSYLQDANDQTLVVFDINYTLTMPNEPAFHMVLLQQNSQNIQKWIKDLTEEEKFWLSVYIVVKGQTNLIEKNTPLLITSIQQKGIKTLALTACPSLKLPSIGQSIELRESEFRAIGIYFNNSFPFIEPFSMKNFKEHYGCYPGFYRGILFCNCTRSLNTVGLATKGEVLRQFLEHINWKPQHVIMIDDELQNLDHIAQTMQKWGVRYTGFHYTGAQDIVIPDISEEAMHITWEDLIKQVKRELQAK